MDDSQTLDVDQAVLQALRRLIRAADLDARELARQTDLSTSQLLVIDLLQGSGPLAVGAIARSIGLTQGTVTTLLDRLEERGLIARSRDVADRRQVHVTLTSEGLRLFAAAPTPLQTRFLERFGALQEWERLSVLGTLLRLVELMGAERIEASPVLDVGRIDLPGAQ